MQQNGTPAGEDELILAVAAGASVREAAERAGVDERTVHRLVADADFRRAVSQARGRMFDAARGRLASLASKAVETLQRLMESDKPSEALGAAKAVSELGPRLRESTEFEERINRLEEDEPDEKIEGNQTPAGDKELVQALAAGATLREAAEQAGVEERTVHGRLADADFRRAVSQARGRLFDSALGRLAGLASRATGVLERLMESDQPSVARRAAKAVLVLGPRLRESTEFEERISRLEEEADEREKHPPKVVIIDNNPWYGEGAEG
jgi:DNA-binding NarL/FixJ family response regulator